MVLVLSEFLGSSIWICQAREEAFWYIDLIIRAEFFLLFTGALFLFFYQHQIGNCALSSEGTHLVFHPSWMKKFLVSQVDCWLVS